MQIIDKTDDWLVLQDEQSDKALALTLASALLVIVAGVAAWNSMWLLCLLALAGAAGAQFYGRKTKITSTLTFERSSDSITLTVENREGTETWEWPLSQLETAEVYIRHHDGNTSGTQRPDLVMTDGTHVPMRPYHAAGMQSWNAVAAVKLFLGQQLKDAPTGWLPPEEFDTLFADEMQRLYQ